MTPILAYLQKAPAGSKQSLFDGYERVIGSKEDQKRFERFIFDLNMLEGTALRHRVEEQLDTSLYLRWLAV
jgi:spore coat protein H